MTNRADEIRKRHKERRKRRLQTEQFKDSSSDFQKSERLRDEFPASRDSSSEGHPLVRKEGMILRVMFAAVLFLVVGILFKNPAPALDQARSFVKETFRNEFQFAMVSDWYKEKFGEPLALLPKGNDSDQEMKAGKTKAPHYAMPVSGSTVTVTQTFADTGQRGIMVETGSNAAVEAVKQGFVSFVGTKPGLGKTVIIQLPDGGEVWYGKLAEVAVKMYDYPEKGDKIGTVTTTENGKSGTFFFALKKNDSFINPLTVIEFE